MSDTPNKTVSLPVLGQVSRRTALKGLGATLGLGAFAAAISPLARKAEQVSAGDFLQQHYKDLDEQERADVIGRLEREAKEQYGANVTIHDPLPIRRDGRPMAPALDRQPRGLVVIEATQEQFRADAFAPGD